MPEQVIGTPRIDVVVDTSQLDVAIGRAKNRLADMSGSAQQEYQKLDKVEKRRIDRLVDQANTLNLTREQQLAYNAALKTSGPILDELTKKIARNGQTSIQGGKSAKEMAFALRGMPAQITDIFTSLQGGQKPLTVLLQQGGQLKDMFGGVRPAVSALGGALIGLINPVTVVTAVTIGLLAAWNKGQSLNAAFNQAIIATGGYAGRTAEQMRGLAGEFDNIAGVTQTAASEIIAKVAASGQFAGKTFDMVSEAAVRASESGLKSVDDVIAAFKEIGKDPVTALLKLNEAERFLTAAQLDRIRALRDEGRGQEAVTEATRLYFNVIQERSGQAREQVTSIASAWRRVKSAFSEALDAAVNADFSFDVLDTPAKIAQHNLDVAKQQLSSISANLRADLADGEKISAARLAADKKRIAELKALIASSRATLPVEVPKPSAGPLADSKEEARKEREKAFRDQDTQYLEGKARLEAEIKKMRRDALKDGISTLAINQREADMRAQFAAKEAKRGGAKKQAEAADPTESIVGRLRQQIALNEEQAKSETTLTATERLLASVRTDLDELGSKATPQARKLIDSLLQQAKASGEAATKFLAEVKAKERLAQLNERLAQDEQNQRRGIEADLTGLTRGGDAAELLRRQLDIQRQYQDQVTELARQASREKRSIDEREEMALRESRDRKLAAEREFQRQRLAIMGDPLVGVQRATDEYLKQARDIAGQTQDIWGHTLQGMEDRMTDLLTKGTADWRGFFNDLQAEIARFIVRQQLSKLMEKFFPDNGNQADALNQSAAALAASAAPLLGAAAALTGAAGALSAAGTAGAASGALPAATPASGGGFFTSLLSIFGGGRASGGDTDPRKFYEVGELNRPELLEEGGRQFLIPGNRGRVTPMGNETAGRGGPSRPMVQSLTQTFVIQGALDTRTQEQLRIKQGREAQRSLARNS